MMDETDDLARVDNGAWTVLRGDAEFELIEAVIPVSGFDEAIEVASKIIALMDGADYAARLDDVQVTIRGWRVETTLSVPRGRWKSVSQKVFVLSLSSLR